MEADVHGEHVQVPLQQDLLAQRAVEALHQLLQAAELMVCSGAVLCQDKTQSSSTCSHAEHTRQVCMRG